MAERVALLERAFAALGDGDVGPFESLFAEEGRWLGIPGSGFEGETPI